eukprot:Lithocolla_globosa_v1_NODE_3969_length_1541_cov_9.732840.p1 type:complete len:293 gc:universal NODE_3969_length_1541_cov_9.732840:28-906(+)
MEDVSKGCNDLMLGFQAAVQGVVLCFTEKNIYKILKNAFWFLCVVISGIFVTRFTITLPLQILVWLLSFFVDVQFTVEWVQIVSNELINVTPFLGLLFVRYIWYQPLDNITKHALHAVDPTFAEELYAIVPRSMGEELTLFAKRTGKLLASYAVVWMLSMLPVVGPFIPPLAELYLLSMSVGLPLAVSISLLSFLPFLHVYSLQILKFWGVCRSLSRELLEPYFCRVRFSAVEKRAFFLEHGLKLVGFTLPYVVALNIPLVGPVVFAFAQAGIAPVLVASAQLPTSSQVLGQ